MFEKDKFAESLAKVSQKNYVGAFYEFDYNRNFGQKIKFGQKLKFFVNLDFFSIKTPSSGQTFLPKRDFGRKKNRNFVHKSKF